jgi:hypothetical protein
MTTIEALCFPMTDIVPTTQEVAVLLPKSVYSRFPVVEALFGTRHRTHDCYVVVDGRRFLICYQFNLSLPRNECLNGLYPEFDWHGQLLVMLAGKRVLVKHLKGTRLKYLAMKAVRWSAYFSWFIILRLIGFNSFLKNAHTALEEANTNGFTARLPMEMIF